MPESPAATVRGELEGNSMNRTMFIRSAFFILLLLGMGAAIGVGQAQDKGANSSPAWKYRVARILPNIVDVDFNPDGTTRKPAVRSSHALDELGKEGWELVTVVLLPETGEYICFLKARK
jgi:hypothetical protein